LFSQVAEYLLITALFREGTPAEAQAALEWLANPDRRFAVRAVKRSAAGVGVYIGAARKRCATASSSVMSHTIVQCHERLEHISNMNGRNTTCLHQMRRAMQPAMQA
jgi:hypothetical protein